MALLSPRTRTEEVSPFPLSQCLLVVWICQHGHSLGAEWGQLWAGGGQEDGPLQRQRDSLSGDPSDINQGLRDLRLGLLPTPESASPGPLAGELVRGGGTATGRGPGAHTGLLLGPRCHTCSLEAAAACLPMTGQLQEGSLCLVPGAWPTAGPAWKS